MSNKPVDTVSMLERVAKLEERVGGGFGFVNKELKEIKEKVPEVKLYPEKKDFTDMHLAILEAIKLVPRKVVILSGTGSRLDHSMATVQLLDLFLKAGIPAVIKDEYNEVSLIDKKISVLKSAYYKYLSVIPFTSSAILTIEGCRYNLTGKKIKRSETRGISNEINRNICTITVIKGKVFLIRSRD